MEILSGKTLAKSMFESMKEELNSNTGRKPRLDVLLVGDNYGSQKYVAMKKKKAQEVGIDVYIHQYDDQATNEELVKLIDGLNSDADIDGIMVQLPFPKGIDSDSIVNRINPSKDVDGLTLTNLGLGYHNSPHILSATPKGILKLLDHYEIDVMKKSICIVGWSKVIGMPLVPHLIERGGTLSICHEFTEDLKSFTSNADIVISATGVSNLITSEHIGENAVVIDVGIGVDENGKLVGDVDFDSVKSKASYISPVPGGVGPLTVACLLENTLEAWKSNRSN